MPYNSTSWKPGQSGNPSGRPKGSANIRKREELLTLVLNAIDKEWGKIVDKQIALALEGDHNAAKLLFDHVLPKQKAYILEREAEDEWDLEGLDTAEKREQARAIMLEAQLRVNELCITKH